MDEKTIDKMKKLIYEKKNKSAQQGKANGVSEKVGEDPPKGLKAPNAAVPSRSKANDGNS
ncbi:hypothetical protein J0B03_11665 [Alkalibacter rhizosphaerae]|uniref:Uncharacterized protein n=1 Tax=Alkalibacter rhizosphaerae TaxID=2815577 RepID=A0A974XM22_9FIRM|nr:hypothetical protein [Alkalibacter rhizosphaerae]QSX08431.1 hypothetical protein J0B03_11665 [Alkalibacter rhizosphaerae]